MNILIERMVVIIKRIIKTKYERIIKIRIISNKCKIFKRISQYRFKMRKMIFNLDNPRLHELY